MKKNRSYKCTIDIIICLCSFIGLFLNFNLFHNPVGIFYYTIFTNVLCFVFYFIVLLKKVLNKYELTDNIIKNKGLVLVSLMCTFMIYNFYMVPQGQISSYDGHFIVSCFVHIFTPLLVLADCIINGKNKMLKYSYLIYWTIIMILYGMMVISYQCFGGTFLDNSKFPYFNFDYEQFGIVGCLCINLIIMLIYNAIGFITVFINRNIIRDGRV